MPQPPSAQQNEVLKLQSEITSEISRDAPAIARGVFGDNKNHPDMSQVSNAQLDDIYRQAYLSNDRQWLQSEARRDPQQFLDVAKRIGVAVPQTPLGVQPSQPPQNAFASAVSANPDAALAALSPPAAPVAAAGSPPVPPPQPALPVPPASPAAPPPVILGPNGQPLPPSGAGLG